MCRKPGSNSSYNFVSFVVNGLSAGAPGLAGRVERKPKPALIRGLNWNHNHEMKNLFKSTATAASLREGVWREFYLGLLHKGMRPEMARLTLARKIAAIALRSGRKEKGSTPSI